ncbi:MAG: OB-fold nucleic acid binding domain-containing protein, partial [Oscillospiraceae bacterium]|nr:OB-fold nucleic acid binding domain-containing protein [Oscillospiraceae bacterium]
SRLAESYVQIIEMQTNHHKKNIAGQIDLLNKNDNDDVIVDYNYPAIEEFTLKERLAKEKESTGMFFSGHLLDDYTQSIKSSDAVPINDVISSFEVEPEMRFYDEHSIVKVAGSITKRVNKTTKNGENMAFITIEDKFAEIEGVMFPKVLTDYLPHIVIDNAVFVTGEITVREEENPKLLVKKVEPIVIDKADKNKTVIESGVKKLYLKVDNMEDIRFQKVCNLIEIFNGSVPVIFYDNSNKKYIKANNLSVYYNDFICNELAEILGKENVILK